jgi:hypothetical protein
VATKVQLPELDDASTASLKMTGASYSLEAETVWRRKRDFEPSAGETCTAIKALADLDWYLHLKSHG